MRPKKHRKSLNAEIDAYLYFRLDHLAGLLHKSKTVVLEDILSSYFAGLEHEDIPEYRSDLAASEIAFLESTGYDPSQLATSSLRGRLLTTCK